MSVLGGARTLRRFALNESGNIAIIAGLVMLPLMVAVGGGVDYGEALRQRGIMQQSADAAALAAAMKVPEQRLATAQTVYFSNYPGPLANSVVSIADYAGGGVTVNAQGEMNTNFLRLVGMNELTLSVSATAVSSATPDQVVTETVEVTTERARTVCMMSLAASGSQTLLVNSPAKIDGGDCDVHVNSGSNDAFIFNTNATLNANEICVAGTAIKRGNTSGTIRERCDAAGDLLAGTLPLPAVGSCTFNNKTFDPPSSGFLTLSPGVYCGWTNFNGRPKINMLPGLYVIKDGGWNVNDGISVTGHGVTFYLTGNGATVNMNGNLSWDISAPRTGTYAGILYFQHPSLPTGNFIMNGRNGQHLEGLIYLPTQNLYFKSRSMAGKTDAVNIVARTILIDGESDWRFKPYDLHAIPGSKVTTTATEQRQVTIPGSPGAPYLVR